MDELDLVRLTRPPVADIDEDALARLRGAALGDAVDPPATDAEPVVDLAELPAPGPEPRRSRRLLVAAAIAAAALVAGGLAVAGNRQRHDGFAVTTDDGLEQQLAGTWRGGAFESLTFLPGADGAVTLQGPCGVFVSRGYRVTGGALVLGEPLTSPEGGCADAGTNESIAALLTLLGGKPAVHLDDCRGLLMRGSTFRCGSLRLGDDTTFTRQGEPDAAVTPTSAITSPTTTIAGAANTQMIEALRGRTFEIAALRHDAMAVPLGRTPTLTFGDRVRLRTVCNDGQATATIVDDRLLLADVETSAVGCPGENEVMALLLGTPRITIAGSNILLVAEGYDAELHESDGTRTSPTTSIGLAPPSTIAGMPTTALAPVAATLDQLAGRQFQGPGPAGTFRFRLGPDGSLTLGFGCNSGGGRASITLGRLTTLDLTRTKMGCEQGNEEDQIFQMFQRDSPTLALEGSTLVILGDTMTLRLDEDRPLTGTRWITNGFVTPQIGLGYAGLKQELTFSPTGRWAYQGRCGALAGTYRVGDGTIAFTLEPRTHSTPACPSDPAADAEEPNLLALFQTAVRFTITGRDLRLVGPDGNGEVFRSPESFG